MKESMIQLIVQHLRKLDDHFWGTFSIRLREGEAVVIIKEETMKLGDEQDAPDKKQENR